jgi:hypothetical protein
MRKITTSSRQHPAAIHDPSFQDVWIATVTTSDGRVYSYTARGDSPPDHQNIESVWIHDRTAFSPGYGGYIG